MKNILVLCTGNSCRSILGEALINHLADGRLQAFSAGSFPIGKVNENALTTLHEHGLSTEGYTSKSWDEFSDQHIDIVITVCDNAAGETCPAYLDTTVRAHWGLSDPAHINGSSDVIKTAFENTFLALESRINLMLKLPLEELSAQELSDQLNKIGLI